jgi:hypothetical protein
VSKSADKKPQKETSTTPINPIPICTILKHLKKLRNSDNSQCVQPHDLKIVLRYSYYSKEGGGGSEPEERAEVLRGKGRASGLSDASA